MKSIVAIAALISLMIGCNNLKGHVENEKIVQSKNDDRNYRYIVLPNELKVLLVSDPSSDKSAASLDVFTGSRYDPINRQGLAHFLEHMLFLGTDKYPKAGEYQTYINAHGGSHNAYTSFEHTNYYFDIEPDYFEESLDRFAQFFISPLFTQAYVDREVRAVHSEYKSKLRSDQRKSLDVFKTLVNPKHPFSKFSVGNLETLSGYRRGAVRSQLIDFYKRHYSASMMTLVVIGRETLGELEKLVKFKFSQISNNGRNIEVISEPLFLEESLPIRVDIQPEREIRTLDFSFQTESGLKFYQQKPMETIGNILGHEGKGSLLSYLKAKGWAEGLSAGAGLNFSGGSTFNITIHLTEKALPHVDEITTSVFQAINRVRNSKKRRSIYQEQKLLAIQQFKYAEKVPPVTYAQRLSAGMHVFHVEDILRGPVMMADYNPQLIDRFLHYLRPENVVIVMSAPEAKTDKVTHFYGSKYGLQKPNRKQIEHWTNAGLNTRINLPEENLFIAKNVAVKKIEVDSLACTYGENTDKSPKKIIDRPGLRLWFKQDDQFIVPKGSLFFNLRSSIASDNAKHNAFLKMYVALVSDELNELSYPAMLAGLRFSLRDHPRGFTVKISGFDDQQTVLLQKILSVLERPGFDPLRFQNIKSEHTKRLKDSRKQQSYRLAMSKLPQLLRRDYWSEQQLLAAYQELTLESLREYSKQLINTGSVDVLVHGNYYSSDAILYSKMIATKLGREAKPPKNIEILQLATSYAHLVDSSYADSAMVFYLQAEKNSTKDRAAMAVTAQIISAEYFHELRTERQLGYVVATGVYPLMDVPGLYFLVQSSTAGPSQLQEEIEGFIKRRVDLNTKLTSRQFNQHKRALISLLNEEPKSLSAQSVQYWQDITQSYHQFDLKEQLIREVELLTLYQWQLFYNNQIAVQSRKGLWIYSSGSSHGEKTVDGIAIDDIHAFKAKSDYYSFH